MFYFLATSKLISGRVSTCDSDTGGDFIVLPDWETRPLAPWPDIPLSHIIPNRAILRYPKESNDKYKYD